MAFSLYVEYDAVTLRTDYRRNGEVGRCLTISYGQCHLENRTSITLNARDVYINKSNTVCPDFIELKNFCGEYVKKLMMVQLKFVSSLLSFKSEWIV